LGSRSEKRRIASTNDCHGAFAAIRNAVPGEVDFVLVSRAGALFAQSLQNAPHTPLVDQSLTMRAP